MVKRRRNKNRRMAPPLKMNPKELLRRSFENVGAYINHLDEIRDLIEKLEANADTDERVLQLLEAELLNAEIILRTDIRILINEFKHLSEER
jgi:hypothetical protein